VTVVADDGRAPPAHYWTEFEEGSQMPDETSNPVLGHVSVASQPTDEIPAGGEFLEPPEEGENPQTTDVTSEGTEAVEGYEHPKGPLSELFTPPTIQFPDIGEASFGPPPPMAESVHGPDDRIQITSTSVYPWRVHCSLLITAADGSRWIGTGWFIGPRTVMTAGHVVYIKNSGVPGRDGWATRVDVMPGRNGAQLPFGSVTSSNLRSVTGWTAWGDQNYDYGAILLPTDLGSRTGWFGFGVYSDADLLGSTLNVAGYPGDKPAGTLWYHWNRAASVNSRKVYYDIDTMGGQSGSSVYRIMSGGRYGAAIHAYGGATTNSGTRVSSPVANNMLAWKA